MQDFRRLRVIAQARVVFKLAYEATATFPSAERFEITSQMRRSALGIGSNIAEGCGRSSDAAFRVSLDRSMGEASELEFQCLAAQDVSLGDEQRVQKLLEETIRAKKMVASLIVTVRKRQGRLRNNEGTDRRPDDPIP